MDSTIYINRVYFSGTSFSDRSAQNGDFFAQHDLCLCRMLSILCRTISVMRRTVTVLRITYIVLHKTKICARKMDSTLYI